ncbi:MAG: ZIP family metal transporter [Candidatus Hodarchaeota archaeon]
MPLLWIISFSLLGSVGAITTAAIFLRVQKKIQEILIPCLIAYASGTLLTVALVGLIPHAFEHTDPRLILGTVLISIILFFLLEKLIIWRHCHEMECETHGTVAPMILIGDAFHNAADGIVIAASFLFSIPIGIAAAISVIAHEIPQEVGDFAILLHAGYSRKKALILNTLSSLSTLPVAIIAYYALEPIHRAIPYAMAISAASFIYISLADLYPELHRRVGLWYEIRQFLMMVLGVGTMVLLLQFHP